jgi:hypothetical protein
MPAGPDNARYNQIRRCDRLGDGEQVKMAGDGGRFTPGYNLVNDGTGNAVDGQPASSSSTGGSGSLYEQVPIGVMNRQNVDFYLDYIPQTFPNAKGNQEVWALLQVNGLDQDPYFHFYIQPGTNHLMMRFAPKASDKEMVVRYVRGPAAYTPPPPGIVPPPGPPPAPPPGGITGCDSGTVTTLAGGGLHRYWRVNVTASNGISLLVTGVSYGVCCAELALRSVSGGANVATGGIALDTNNFPLAVAGNAFDGDPATFWAAAGPIYGSFPYLGAIGYQWPSPVSIMEFAWTNRDDVPLWTVQSPTEMTLDWSDDGSTWTPGWLFTLSAACWTGPNQTMVFTTDSSGAVPPPPPGPTATLTIWAEYSGTVNGVPAMSYTFDGGLTWVGGDGTLPGDAGMQI